jgi:Cupin domain
VEDSTAKDIDYFITGVKEAASINLWATSKTPPALENIGDPTQSGLPFLPSKNGTILRICDIPPDSLYIHRLDEVLLNNQKISDEQKMQKHPLIHKVDCLIYAVVLDGEVTLILDKTETKLKSGDVIIDCGSNHAWSNHTNQVCRMLFVLLDATRN